MMHVRLVSYSRPTEEFANMGIHDCQDLVAYCARVSNPANQDNTETSERLIRYLIQNRHWSPLEMVNVCLEITTTRDIARQLLRHRSFSFQEFSQRYADPVQELDFEFRDARLQDPKNRQNSLTTEDATLQADWYLKQAEVINVVREAYQWAIARGIAREQARVVLPEGLMQSRLYVNGTLRSWIHYIDLRHGNGTQREHADLARVCAEVIAKVFPMAKEFVGED